MAHANGENSLRCSFNEWFSLASSGLRSLSKIRLSLIERLLLVAPRQSPRDDSINRPRRKARRGKTLRLRKRGHGTSDFDFGKCGPATFSRPANSILFAFQPKLFRSTPTFSVNNYYFRRPVANSSPWEFSSSSALRTVVSPRPRHEIRDLAESSLHSRQIFHASFVALSSIVNGKIAPILLSLGGLLAVTAIVEEARLVHVAITRPEELRGSESSDRTNDRTHGELNGAN